MYTHYRNINKEMILNARIIQKETNLDGKTRAQMDIFKLNFFAIKVQSLKVVLI